ncbi:MAG TPA: bifunctional diguanylate cyclase/phosphodiesterase [Acidimicrobiales bacterium]|nr:bifunctional diguanylate cyclase/phosphodiesterase [Acidimicrobiales bacterium]
MTEPADRGREVTARFAAALAAYLDGLGGPELVAEWTRAATAAGLRPPADAAAGAWISRAELAGYCEAAAALSGDGEIGRRLGEELLRLHTADPMVAAVVTPDGGPGAALTGIVEYLGAVTSGRRWQLAVDAGSAVLEASPLGAAAASRHFCAAIAGYLAALPGAYGSAGRVAHRHCEVSGAPSCRWELRWTQGGGGAAGVVQLGRWVSYFDAMTSAAAVAGSGRAPAALAESLLDTLEQLVPSPILVARVDGPDGAVTAARGVAPAAADDLADDLVAGRCRGGALWVPLGRSGLLGALAPDSPSLPTAGGAVLTAFSRLAGAVTEAAAARRDAELARAETAQLLDFAGRLAGATDLDDVAGIVATTTEKVTGATLALVLAWDAARGLVPLGQPGGEASLGRAPVDPVELPDLLGLADRSTPLRVAATECGPGLGARLSAAGATALVMRALADDGAFEGLLVAAYPGPGDVPDDAERRLDGVADLARVALARARALETARYQATHDALTGLYNRNALGAIVPAGGDLELLYIDIDRLKHVNDELGHAAGDAVLAASAQRISAAAGPDAFVARAGGDEFVVVRTRSRAEAPRHGDLVASAICAALSEPFDLAGRDVYVGASIGIASSPSCGHDLADLVTAADAAMYQSKRSGRGSWRRASGAHTRGGGLEDDLHRALRSGEITVVYQPQVELAGLVTVAVEALVRWDHPRRGLITPAQFLDIAETAGVLAEVDREARRLALAQARLWAASFGGLPVSVNLSTQSLIRPHLVDEFAADLAGAGVDPTAVEVEIVEGILSDKQLIAVVSGLADLGVRVAIDDFGTGASVFARLKRLPVHTLKIDRSLVAGGDADRDAPILAAVVEMGRRLGLEVVAEGVENPAQASRLRRLGATRAQGWLFGQPTTAAEIERLVCSQAANVVTGSRGPAPSPLAPGVGRVL